MVKAEVDFEFRLGQLLLYFGIISGEDLRRGLNFSTMTGLPLGKSLVYLESIQEFLIHELIQAQSMLRDRLIDLEEARAAVSLVRQRSMNFDEALISLGIKSSQLKGSRLGELLVNSSQISSGTLQFGLSVSDASGLPLGQVLVLVNQISEDNLRISLALQKELRSGLLNMEQVLSKLQVRHTSDVTVENLPCLSWQKLKLSELLVRASLVSQERVDELLHIASDERSFFQLLIQSELITNDVLGEALKLLVMIFNEVISIDEAVNLLEDALRKTQLTSTGDAAQCISLNFYDFLFACNFLTQESEAEVIAAIAANGRLSNIVTIAAIEVGFVNEMELPQLVRLAFAKDSVLRCILKETLHTRQDSVESAYVLYRLFKEGKLTLCQAIINYVVKKGMESNRTSLGSVA